jgi:IS30 family transposase
VAMGKHYSHLTVTERERLAKMYYERRSLADIAKALDRNKSTISRELSMVRWYLPRGTDFRNITEDQTAAVESRINNRPRKCLKYRTPLEVFTRVVALRS